LKASAAFLFVLVAAALGGPRSADAASVDYLYLASNVGGSSGGHVALRFGAIVFDYRLGELRTLRLHRTPIDAFRYGAQVLGNRTIRASRVEIPEDHYEALWQQFNRRYLIARRSFAMVEALREEQRWLERRAHDASTGAEASRGTMPEVAGAGFFDLSAPKDSESPALAALRARIESRYGVAFLAERIRDFEAELAGLEPTRAAPIAVLAPDAWPPAAVLFTERQRELAQWIVALRALGRAAPLRPEALRNDGDAAPLLAAEERAALAGFAGALEASLVELVASVREDAGLALLVGLARLDALARTPATGRLYLLDAFPAGADLLAPSAPRAGPDPYLTEWHDHAAARFAAARARLADPRPLREPDYARLEESGNRWLELHDGLAGRRAIRRDPGLELPAPRAAVSDLPLPILSEPELAEALAAARLRHVRALQALRDAYGYDLIARNCVTELLSTIGDSLQERAVEPRLGPLAFIPFLSFAWFGREHEVTRSWQEPSLRHARIAAQVREENDLLVFARESNTLSSTIYRHHDGEGFFLFFTDDRLLLRPLFGAFNLAAGLAQSVYGVGRLPFDAGRMLRAGLASAGYSLPELLFVNIRKGTLRYGPGALLPNEADPPAPAPAPAPVPEAGAGSPAM